MVHFNFVNVFCSLLSLLPYPLWDAGFVSFSYALPFNSMQVMWNKFLGWDWTSQLSTFGDEPNFFSAVISLCQIMDLDVHPCRLCSKFSNKPCPLTQGFCVHLWCLSHLNMFPNWVRIGRGHLLSFSTHVWNCLGFLPVHSRSFVYFFLFYFLIEEKK